MDEVSFWLSFVKSLEDLEKQLERPEVKLSLEILKYAKKQHEVVNKEEFKNMKKNADIIEKIMSDLNFNQVLISLKKDENNIDFKDFFS